jgi:hypothetical protein
MKTYRQTTIWEFMNKKILTTIEKLKAIHRIKNNILNSDKIAFVNRYMRASNLYFLIVDKLTSVQMNYVYSLIEKLLNSFLPLKEYERNMHNFFNYYILK